MHQFSHLTGGAVHWIFIKLARLIRPSHISAIGGFLGLRASNGSRKDRREDMRTVFANLNPQWSKEELDSFINTNWKRVGSAMLEVPVMDRVIRNSNITVEGIEHITERPEGQGAILAFVHLGAWEMILHQIARHKITPYCIYQAPANPIRAQIAKKSRLDIFFSFYPNLSKKEAKALNKAKSHHLMEGSLTAIRKTLKGLKAGDVAWLAVDECVDGHVHGPWLGKHWKRKGNLEIVAKLSQKSGAPIIPVWCIKKAEADYTITFDTPIVQSPNLTANDLAEELANRLNPQIAANLEQWFMAHELRPTDFADAIKTNQQADQN